MIESGGRTANTTGDNFEGFIAQTLQRKKYAYIEPAKFAPAMYLDQPIYSHKVKIGENIYGVQSEFDFAIYHPQKHPQGLIIEVKWQQARGTTDEKLPFLVMNIQYKYPFKTILILDGAGWRPGAVRWVRSQIGNNLLNVYSMVEFQTWMNKGGF